MPPGLDLRVLDSVSDPAHAPNEDVWGFTQSALWVIDGASSVDDRTVVDPVSDGAWIARRADEVLRRGLAGSAEDSPRSVQVLREAAGEVGHAMESAAASADSLPPSAAVAIGEVVGTDLHVVQLADVAVIVYVDGQTRALRDAAAQRAEMDLARSLGGVRGPGRPEVDAVLRARRRAEMNQSGGTWVLSDEPRAVEQARHEVLPIADFAHVLVMSDGFSRLVDVFQLAPTWEQVMDRLVGGLSLADMARELREAERKDPEGSRHPRLTRHDDATAVHVLLTSNGRGD